MRSTLSRFGSIAMLIGFGLLSMELGPRTFSRRAQSQVTAPGGMEILSFAWGASQSQTFRICLSNPEVSPQSSDPTETVSLHFAKIQTQAGNVVLERELRVPVGEFRCVDISYDELVAAGLDPEPTSLIQYLIVIDSRSSRGRTDTVGASQRVTVGALQSINVGTGKIELYQSFDTRQTRQLSIVQDL